MSKLILLDYNSNPIKQYKKAPIKETQEKFNLLKTVIFYFKTEIVHLLWQVVKK